MKIFIGVILLSNFRSSPQWSESVASTGGQFSCEIEGISPSPEALPLELLALGESGDRLFTGYLIEYETHYTPERVTSLKFADAGRHTRRRPIFGTFKGTFGILVDTLIDKGKATQWLSPVVFLVGNATIPDPEPHEGPVTDLPVELFLQGEY